MFLCAAMSQCARRFAEEPTAACLCVALCAVAYGQGSDQWLTWLTGDQWQDQVRDMLGSFFNIKTIKVRTLNNPQLYFVMKILIICCQKGSKMDEKYIKITDIHLCCLDNNKKKSLFCTVKYKKKINLSSVVDSYHFDLNPDPRIRIGEKRILILFWIRIRPKIEKILTFFLQSII